MGEITFVLGGSRSGKSLYATKLAKGRAERVVFVATAAALDKEMQLRIKLHRKNRPSHWKTIEEPKKLSSLIKNFPLKFDLIIIDCLTLFISNLLLEGCTDKYIENEIESTLKILKKYNFDSILVSNEVGLGIVPDNPLARRFRDLAGKINQNVAGRADKVFFLVSGIPWRIK
jgi:adenosylcobinamide kinase/adenosylcobinamide-phosphate guanylyltransferase